MKAMILAGGMSTRLYPLTRLVPKPLVPIAGEPNTAHLLRYLQAYGTTDVAMNVFYLADQIVQVFGDGSAYGVQLHYLHERELMGSAGALKQMHDFFDETFVVIGCDVLTNIDLARLLRFHRERGALATIGLHHVDLVDQFGVVILGHDGRIQEFQEKPQLGEERSHLVNTGVYVFEPEILEHIPADRFVDFGNHVFPALLAGGYGFYGLEMEGAYWTDIGTPETYRQATHDVLEGRITPFGSRRVGVADSASIASDVVIAGDVRVGEHAQIAAGARIVGPSVIGDRAVVEAGAVIEESILFNGARIGAKASLKRSIVGLSYAVPAQTLLEDAVVAYEERIAGSSS